jgi:hypothetical protein
MFFCLFESTKCILESKEKHINYIAKVIHHLYIGIGVRWGSVVCQPIGFQLWRLPSKVQSGVYNSGRLCYNEWANEKKGKSKFNQLLVLYHSVCWCSRVFKLLPVTEEAPGVAG